MTRIDHDGSLRLVFSQPRAFEDCGAWTVGDATRVSAEGECAALARGQTFVGAAEYASERLQQRARRAYTIADNCND